MEEKKNIFREKAITRVTSPEQLNEYIRVATPGIWFILIAILLALAGMFVWIVFGKIDATLTTAGIAQNGSLTCYVPENKHAEVNVGDMVKVNEKTYQIACRKSFGRSVGLPCDNESRYSGRCVSGGDYDGDHTPDFIH